MGVTKLLVLGLLACILAIVLCTSPADASKRTARQKPPASGGMADDVLTALDGMFHDMMASDREEDEDANSNTDSAESKNVVTSGEQDEDEDDEDDEEDDEEVPQESSTEEEEPDSEFHEQLCGKALRESHARSKFQHIRVITTESCGKSLLLDGVIQSTGADEHHYHEALVHPALLLHPNPKTVMIGGGGEMATAREILRHKSVEKLIMVDIDEKLVKFCLEELPEWNNGAYEDNRTTVIFGDAVKYIKEYPDKFDVIYFDIVDPLDGGPEVQACYSPSLYQEIYSKLNPGGVFVTQSGPCNPTENPYSFAGVHFNLKAVFPNAHPYCLEVETFGGDWGFNMGIVPQANGEAPNPRLLSETHIDKLIQERIANISQHPLHFFDGQSHHSMFSFEKGTRLEMKELGKTLLPNAKQRLISGEPPPPPPVKDEL